MSVAFADYDQDGYPDVFVTNDNMPNFLFHNRATERSRRSRLLAGVALRDHGKPVASMGAEFRDYDNDGLPDIASRRSPAKPFPCSETSGRAFHRRDLCNASSGPQPAKHSGWGSGLFDFNNDGWKDLFTADSHVNDRVELFEAAVYKEPNSVFREPAERHLPRCVRGMPGMNESESAPRQRLR